MNSARKLSRRPILPGDRRGDSYALPERNGTIRWYVRVSNVLDEVAKQRFLGPWHGRMAARYAFQNPFATEDEAVGAAYRFTAKAADKGALIHSWVEAVARGATLSPDALPRDHQGHARAFLKFAAQYQPELVAAESSVFNRTHRYAGQGDLLVRMQSGDLVLLDVKTGRAVYPFEMSLQLTAYRHCDVLVDQATREVQPMPRIDYAGVLHLQASGMYSLHELPDRMPDFLAYLHIFRRRKEQECVEACWCRGAA